MSSGFVLHKLVFAGDDAAKLEAALTADNGALSQTSAINQLDNRGNTALHIAVMLGRKESIRVLLAYNASVLEDSAYGSKAMHEARVFGDRDVIKQLMVARTIQTKAYFEMRAEAIVKQLNELDDFYMEMKWEFSSWVPLLSRFCPNDTLKIRKKGACMRVDTTLVGFEGISWVRGNIGYVFNPANKGQALTIVDYEKKLFEVVDGEAPKDNKTLEERINMLLNFTVRHGDLDATGLAIKAVKTGVFGFGSGKSEKVGEYDADVFTIEGLKFKSVIRSEHLDAKLVPKDAAAGTLVTAPSADGSDPFKDIIGENPNMDDSDPKAREELLKKFDGKKEADVDAFVANTRKSATKYKPSLIPPAAPTITAEQYFNPAQTQYVHLNRPLSAQTSTRNLKATLWMSNSFPLFVEQLFPLMEIMSPSNEHFARLRDFIDLKLPRGFPIKIEIPLFGILTARITFQNYRVDQSFDDSIFAVPEGFKADEIRFFDN